MGFLSDMFSSPVAPVIESTGGVIEKTGKALDELFTSDEERAKARIALKQLEADLTLKLRQLDVDWQAKVMQAEVAFDGELTERLKADVVSRSWLSRNIRPGAFLGVLTFAVVLAFYTLHPSTKANAEIVELWTALLTAVLMAQVVFYYGSRGLEKLATILGPLWARTKK